MTPSERYGRLMAEEVEAVARQQAAAVGFDLTEPEGLLMAMQAAMMDSELMKRIAERARRRFDAEGSGGEG